MKAIYRNKKSGDLFAIETDEAGNVLSSCGPLLFGSLDPKLLDYDDYWNSEIAVKMGEFEKIGASIQNRVCSGAAHPTESAEFERLTRDAYRELLIKNGFVIQSWQRKMF
jgi:hypothetical protein